MATNELVAVLLKISVLIFMTGSMLDTGLQIHPPHALRGLKDVRFVVHTLLWSFVIGPAVAVLITMVLPLDKPYALGLVLLGMAPSAPFMPVVVRKAQGDLGYAAAFLLIVGLGTTVFMPFAVPLLVTSLSVSAWAIARPMLIIVLLPIMIGMVIRHYAPAVAAKLHPVAKKVTGLVTIPTIILILLRYGEGIIGAAGSFAVASQLIFFSILMAFPYWFSFGMGHRQKVVLSIGLSTRNVGAAVAPLFSVAAMDQRAFVMMVLALPIMALFAWLSVRWFGPPALANAPVPGDSTVSNGHQA